MRLERAVIGVAGKCGVLSKGAGVVEGGGTGVGLQDRRRPSCQGERHPDRQAGAPEGPHGPEGLASVFYYGFAIAVIVSISPFYHWAVTPCITLLEAKPRRRSCICGMILTINCVDETLASVPSCCLALPVPAIHPCTALAQNCQVEASQSRQAPKL